MNHPRQELSGGLAVEKKTLGQYLFGFTHVSYSLNTLLLFFVDLEEISNKNSLEWMANYWVQFLLNNLIQMAK